MSHPIPFAEAGPRYVKHVGRFERGYPYTTRLDTTYGYLHSLLIETRGTVSRYRLTDCNGAPIIDISPEGLAVYRGDTEQRLPIALYEDGTGALPDMNPSCAYSLEVIDATDGGEIYAEYWPIRSPTDWLGRKVNQYPPHLGTTAWLNEIETREKDNELVMPRVGNNIAYLALIPDGTAIKGALGYDLQTARFLCEPLPPLVFIDAKTSDQWLPTVASTVLRATALTPEVKSGRWILRDVGFYGGRP